MAYVSNGYQDFVATVIIDNRYALDGLVGSGGMADVFLARDELLDRDVALKLLKHRYADNEEFVERFRREARSAAALANPFIVPIFDRGETEEGTYYIAMEYLPGGTLKDQIVTEGRLSPQQTMEVGLQVAEALQTAHERGIVHRDVKPRNILLADSGHVKVTDFGIARAAEATTISNPGDILGSAKYMSPEQAAGGRVGPASDLYSLGVVLYEMLTGTVPFKVDTPWDVADAHASGLPLRPSKANPDVTKGIDALIMGLLATDPKDRYQTAAEVIDELRSQRDRFPQGAPSSEDETIALAAAAYTERAASSATGHRRRVPWMLAAIVTLVALLGSAGWILLQGPGPEGIPDPLRGLLREPPEAVDREAPKPTMLKVPEVRGLGEREARGRLAEAGFESGIRSRESAEEDAGKVLDQSVRGGQRADKGSKIVLTIADGEGTTRVPKLVGIDYPEAETKLEEAGFLLGGVEEVASETEPAGVIVEQDPPAGTVLKPGGYVYLTTSVGRPDESGADGG
jgi:serine/threonine-protein kinase